MSLAEVKLFRLPRSIVSETERQLRAAGTEGMERFVLWSGQVDGAEFIVRTAHVPEQTSYQLDSGLLVRVEGDALHQLNRWLYEHGEALAVQVHGHPTGAFHSETDDAYPIVTERGSVSIVAADFCRAGLLSASTAAYRLSEYGWDPVSVAYGLFEVI